MEGGSLWDTFYFFHLKSKNVIGAPSLLLRLKDTFIGGGRLYIRKNHLDLMILDNHCYYGTCFDKYYYSETHPVNWSLCFKKISLHTSLSDVKREIWMRNFQNQNLNLILRIFYFYKCLNNYMILNSNTVKRFTLNKEL